MIDGQPLKVSCGVGVNSVAMLAGMRQIGLPPDAILFADTGSEMPGTYAYIPTLQAWLARVGFPEMVIVKNPSPKAHDASLYDELWRCSLLPSIAYGFQRHSCALKWKARPQEQWCKRWPLAQEAWARGVRVKVAIGYDEGGGDCKRYFNAVAMEEKSPSKHFTYWYPLRDWGWDRARCVAAIEQEGLPVPVKSSCFFCASRTKPEILAMARDEPDTLVRAIELERRAMPKLRKIKGLGCKFNWSEFLFQDAVRKSSLDSAQA